MKGECLICGDETTLDSRSVCIQCNAEFSEKEIKGLLEEREMKES